ncbi:MAG: DUF4114 domain-containing protein [Methylophilaceae bacterium]|nr:DUF4114 domain-containing protein [Methylophilaceae bacterium]
MKLLNKILFTVLSLSAVLPAYALDSSAVEPKTLLATGGNVRVTFLSSDADYSSDLFVTGKSDKIFNNKSTFFGQTFDLGDFAANTAITFSLLVNNTGYQFYSGFTSANPDNIVHSAISNLGNNVVAISFEDMFGGGDYDYNDVMFTVTNAVSTNVAPVPEPESFAMLIAGLGALLLANRRRKANKTLAS